ncbi:uncharacterized protein LOC129290806 isoform X2 [Prosopis cineraria]|uniref:uncharacterized protein LOC129290806 isoform X2 n=1 Tax=Prosopis cineraria TaxID=364024 RepID=UPI00240FF297|nr:uncharacterized protein LOC129290806 isoform X2 [Prosopis cineraria]
MQNAQIEREVASSPRSAEGRRKRIAERGSDRMALITGQIQTLPPLPPPPPPTPSPRSSPRFHLPPRHLRPESLPVELSQEFHPDLRNTHSFSIPASEEAKEGSRFSSRLRHQSGFKIPKQKNFEVTSEEESLLQDSNNAYAEATKHQVDSVNDDSNMKSTLDTLSHLNAAASSDDEDNSNPSGYSSRQNLGGIKFSKRSNFHIRTKVKPLTQDSDIIHEEEKEQEVVKSSSATPRAQNKPSDGKKKNQKPVSFNPTLFSSREINSSIIASETFRAFCALIIAVLVVLCYMISEEIAAIRPLFIVLLNDVTIVLARVHMEKIRASEEEEGGEKVEANNELGHDWTGVKLLERGLVAYQAIRDPGRHSKTS